MPYRVLMALLLTMAGCASPAIRPTTAPTGAAMHAAELTSPLRFVAADKPVELAAARNEWISFALQIDNLPPAGGKTAHFIRFNPLQYSTSTATIAPALFQVYQVVNMPVDVNRAGFVRHTGLAATERRLPRALLPLTHDNGLLNLATIRPAEAGEPLVLWIDLLVPTAVKAGQYGGRCDLMTSGNAKPLSSVNVALTVHDFVLPDERHLLMTGTLDWDTLTRLYPERFEAVSPRLVNRRNERYADVIKTFDSLMRLAQQHRTQLIISALQPTVKWPAGKPPLVDWEDFDSIVQPWMSGQAFADRIPLGYWPLPPVAYLTNYDRRSQLEYWQAAAMHFDQMDWLGRSAVMLDGGEGRAADAENYSLAANLLLNLHPNLRVALPLDENAVMLGGELRKDLIQPEAAGRILAAAPSLVFAAPAKPWPEGVNKPQRWLRTDLPGLVPYAGAGGEEQDVRLWSWLAFLRDAQFILWKGALPTHTAAAQPADPNELIWFYPGSWFGRDEPVASIQLKWLRRAQQDFEYLWLARTRGEVLNALVMARLITKPVEIAAGENPDPIYALMSGTTDPAAWQQVRQLLARTIQLRQPGQSADPAQQRELNLQTLRWMEPRERPLLLGRTTQWKREADSSWLSLNLGVDIYNASDNTPDENLLQYSALPPGWQVKPQPLTIPALATYQVRRANLDARFNLDQIGKAARRPMELTFTHGFTRKNTLLRLALPVAVSDRRQAKLVIDGSLDEWSGADALHEGPLVRMLTRPAVERQELQFAPTPSALYSAWADENFYLAFKVGGIVNTSVRTTRNFVDYQFRRAWGEDLCELLIQPVYADGTAGGVIHLVCKPTGQWIERKTAGSAGEANWEAVEGAGVRYASSLETDAWRGEVAIPWKLIRGDDGRMPALLRFNFVQHQATGGQSASWAGPVDFGRDDSFMGALVLRQLSGPGMRE